MIGLLNVRYGLKYETIRIFWKTHDGVESIWYLRIGEAAIC